MVISVWHHNIADVQTGYSSFNVRFGVVKGGRRNTVAFWIITSCCLRGEDQVLEENAASIITTEILPCR
jgi:hypothetical protein